ncbi:MAG: aminopeptidase P family protein [Acidobacteria bacterium]|nr:aminopeptidase P family protein [Acidobacteriota bacterium]
MSDPPSPHVARRHLRLREALGRLDLDLLVVSSLPNVFYLSGFNGSAGLFVIGPKRAVLITDGRYKTAAREQVKRAGAGQVDLVIVQHTYEQTLAELLKGAGARRIGFEAAHLTVSRYRWLAAALDATQDGDGTSSRVALMPTEAIVEELRAIKDEAELAAIREAARRLASLFEPVLEEVRPGCRERDVAARVEWRLRAGGFSRSAFPAIVASGPNTAHPHARAGDRILERGDLVMLDFGGVYDEYCVDLTRMISLGSPDARLNSTYRAVKEAQDAAIQAVRAGIPGHAVDRAARASLEGAGLAEAFPHGTGHGLGIEVHESPRIALPPQGDSPVPGSLTSAVMLAPNMVFTIEPGVYFAGWGGVRLEDDVLVTPHGCEVLTKVTRELIER